MKLSISAAHFSCLVAVMWTHARAFSDWLTPVSTIFRVLLTICICSSSKWCQKSLIFWSHSPGPGPDTRSDLTPSNVYRGLLHILLVLVLGRDSVHTRESSDFSDMMGCDRNLVWSGAPADFSILFQDFATKKLGAVFGVHSSVSVGSWDKTQLRIHFTSHGIPLIWCHMGSRINGTCWILCSVKLSTNTARTKEEKPAVARNLIPFTKTMEMRFSAGLVSTPGGLISSRKSAHNEEWEQ